MSKKLEILKASLEKKEAHFTDRLSNHIDTVKQANGQPLNDKRNGQATLNKWEKQNEALRNIQKGIEKTKDAIEFEESRIRGVEVVKETLPAEVLALVEAGTLIQWRKHPNTFFVEGVDKARIVWDNRKKVLSHKYAKQVANQEQYSKFRDIYNNLYKAIAA